MLHKRDIQAINNILQEIEYDQALIDIPYNIQWAASKAKIRGILIQKVSQCKKLFKEKETRIKDKISEIIKSIKK